MRNVKLLLLLLLFNEVKLLWTELVKYNFRETNEIYRRWFYCIGRRLQFEKEQKPILTTHKIKLFAGAKVERKRL